MSNQQAYDLNLTGGECLETRIKLLLKKKTTGGMRSCGGKYSLCVSDYDHFSGFQSRRCGIRESMPYNSGEFDEAF